MLILALDTTTRAGSVALLDDDRLVAECAGDAARTHAERLPGDLLALLAAHGRRVGDVELFAVGSGPGSFTGLRIGIATAQGLALVRQRSLVGVPALEALAHAGSVALPPGARVAAWMDGYRRDIFSALYEVGSAPPFMAGRLIELEGPSVGDPAATLERWVGAGTPPSHVVGDGARLHGGLATAMGASVMETPLLAAAMGRLARQRAAQGEAGHPAAIQAFYVRRPDVEVNREKREGQSLERVADPATDVGRPD